MDDRTGTPGLLANRAAAFCVAGLAALTLVGAGSWLWGQRVGTERAVDDVRAHTGALGAQILAADVVAGLLTDDPLATDQLNRLIDGQPTALLDATLWSPEGDQLYSRSGETPGETTPLDATAQEALSSRSPTTELRTSSDPSDTVLRVHYPVERPEGDSLLLQADYDYEDITANGLLVWRAFAPGTLGALLALAVLWMLLAAIAGRRSRALPDYRDAEPLPRPMRASRRAPDPWLDELELGTQVLGPPAPRSRARPGAQPEPVLNTAVLSSGPLSPLSSSGPMRPLTSSGPMRPLTSSGPMRPLPPSGPTRQLRSPEPAMPISASGPLTPIESSGPLTPLSSSGPLTPIAAPSPVAAPDQGEWLGTIEGGTPWPAVQFSEPVSEEDVQLPGALRDGGPRPVPPPQSAPQPVLGTMRTFGTPPPTAASNGNGHVATGARSFAARGARTTVQAPERRRSLETALSSLLAPLARQGIDIRLDLPPGLELPVHIEALLVRAAEEAITNAVAHAQARTVKVRLDLREQRVELTVDDDGRGFDASDLSAGPGSGRNLGLRTLTRQATEAGGSLHIRSAPDRGTRLHLDLPIA